ncbi:MAG TPA: hypothetical protein ENJ51_00300 [Leucothrix mucor]|uniref:Nucleoside recognition protein n=1 Tax=Leucothrix mucor TaxID=45248 RepID=A0A7V2SXH0_LEUMU|nr:hypothetical protein [Leucothrix mucor]
MKTFFKTLSQEIFDISYTLFKLMIPVIIAVKILEELGVIEYLGIILEPLMSLVGLPESMGLVWATTVMTSIYGGMVIFVSQAPTDLSVAQVTILGGMMLLAHGLPVEVRIAQKAGMSIWFSLLIRVGGGILYGWLLFYIYSAGDWLQQPNQLIWQAEVSTDTRLIAWGVTQLKSLAMIQIIIIALLFFLKILKRIGIEKLLAIILSPILKILGISTQATTITIVGITLGLAYGGGLLIKEAQQGKLAKKDVFTAIALLALLHSLIEDTLLILLLGADLSGVLWFRLLFSLVLISVFSRLVLKMNDKVFERVLCSKV